jgi:penicillin-binding protein 1B
MVLGVVILIGAIGTAAAWVVVGQMIDKRLAGGLPDAPRIFARPFEVRERQALSSAQLIARLNDVGYAQRENATRAGEFSVADRSIQFVTRGDGNTRPGRYLVTFTGDRTPFVSKVVDAAGNRVPQIALEPALLASLSEGERRRHVPLAELPSHVVGAVLAIEDRRFYDHPGVDPIRAVGAILTNLRGDRPYLEGASTLTQQIVKNTFLTPEKTLRRKLQEQFMAIVLETRLTKDQILELYLNDVVLGQRGPFAIHGVPEAARIFFGKDVRNLSIAEAATIAGLIQSPSRLAPQRHPERARERRDVVLEAMVDTGVITRAQANAAANEPLRVTPGAMENEAPYFVDYASEVLDQYADGILERGGRLDIHTTLDLHLQRYAHEAVARGMAEVDKRLAGRKRQTRPQVAFVAVDPRTGEILAMVGGRSYSQTQYNRATLARRQPGSVFKPFVYLTAFEQTARGHLDMTPATLVLDEPTAFEAAQGAYVPANFDGEYQGFVTLRSALASSRNIVAVKVAQAAGLDNIAALWSKVGVGTRAQAVPSIALGVFEATPLEMAQAYTVFAGNGIMRPLTPIRRVVEGNDEWTPDRPSPTRIARPETTYLVTDMMRSVLDEGSGAGARAAGFTLEAAGKTGTTNDLRDAWFIGFTPELLAVVWVGYDDNQPLGLTGSQAALPIWTDFMRRALAGRPSVPFEPPDNVVSVAIDKDTGQLATDSCPRVHTEVFLSGHEPTEACQTHGSRSFFSRVGSFFGFGR